MSQFAESESPSNLEVKQAGVSIGVRPAVNLIAGSNIGVSAVDNPSGNRVDVTFSAALFRPDRMVFALTPGFATIQSAIDYAETLGPANDPADFAGIGVIVPSGAYAEDLIIRKNVSLVGQGNLCTTISSVTYRPVDDTFSTSASSVSNMRITGKIEINKETAAGSGIFNYFIGLNRILFFNVNADYVVIDHAQNVEFDSCIIDNFSNPSTMLNSQATNCNNSIFGPITFTVDDSLFPPSYLETYFPNGNLVMYNCSMKYGSTLSLVTGAGTSFTYAYLFARNTYISQLTQGDNSSFNIEGGAISTRTVGTPLFGSTFRVPNAPVMTTRAAPKLIAAGTFTSDVGSDQLLHVAGDAGPQVVTAIAAGAAAGDRLRFLGVDDVNTVGFTPGVGLVMPLGAVTLGDGGYVEFVWDGAASWIETGRNQ